MIDEMSILSGRFFINEGLSFGEIFMAVTSQTKRGTHLKISFSAIVPKTCKTDGCFSGA